MNTTETTLYIYDPSFFNGNALNTMPFVDIYEKNGQYKLNFTQVHYTNETFAEYNQRHGGRLLAVTWAEFWPVLDAYNKKTFCREWIEVTAIQYYEALECLPPCKWHDINERFNSFYISEATTADLHSFYIKDKVTGKFYSATRSRYISDTELILQLNDKV